MSRIHPASFFVVLALVATLIAAGPAAAKRKKRVLLKLQQAYSMALPVIGDGIVWWAEQLKEASDGSIVVKIYEPGKLVALHTRGKLDNLLPVVHGIGFEIVYPIRLDAGVALEIKRAWSGRLSLIGEFPISLLTSASPNEIEAQVRETCLRLAPSGGYAIGSSSDIADTVPPENFVAMTRAVHRYGRYGSLGSTVADGTPSSR